MITLKFLHSYPLFLHQLGKGQEKNMFLSHNRSSQKQKEGYNNPPDNYDTTYTASVVDLEDNNQNNK